MEIRAYRQPTRDQNTKNLDAPRSPREPHPQIEDHDTALVSLQTASRPLQLILKIMLEKISDVFELHDNRSAQVARLELTEEAVSAQTVTYLALAYHTFKNRFADTEQSAAIDRFVTLARQTVSEALQEASMLLAQMQVNTETTDNIVMGLDEKIHKGLEHIAARIIL